MLITSSVGGTEFIYMHW